MKDASTSTSLISYQKSDQKHELVVYSVNLVYSVSDLFYEGNVNFNESDITSRPKPYQKHELVILIRVPKFNRHRSLSFLNTKSF